MYVLRRAAKKLCTLHSAEVFSYPYPSVSYLIIFINFIHHYCQIPLFYCMCHSVRCSPGKYRSANNTCNPCQNGTYSDSDWQRKCTVCPRKDNRTTLTAVEEATSPEQCSSKSRLRNIIPLTFMWLHTEFRSSL